MSCAIPGENDERSRLEGEGARFQMPHDKRELPPLEEEATEADVLYYAFNSNAMLEAAYFEWKMAIERVPQMASLDDPRFTYGYLFSKEMMSSWDRTTLGISQMVPFPGKLETAGKVALQEAMAAGMRFENTKFMLQADVLMAWYELVYIDTAMGIAQENLTLHQDFAESLRTMLATGMAGQAEVSMAEADLAMADNDLKMRQAERPPALAKLNALLSRPPKTSLRPQVENKPRALPERDDEVLALAAERNKELQAMAAEVQGREHALELARKAYLPDFELSFNIVGSMERMFEGMLTLPLQLRRIRAGIEEAGAGVRAAQAMLRARKDDIAANVILQLSMARDSARQAALFKDTLIPRVEEIVSATRQSYSTGGASFMDVVEARRSLLAFREGRAYQEMIRDSATAELEALCALDFGRLGDVK
ncbi:MAG: TolC family protein [Planctomycetes bacterium]|nr:TolC family protein [Planctomycetota bacterium]NUQ33875.1 TolC family protein [Planctomycetaceae bacterium]